MESGGGLEVPSTNVSNELYVIVMGYVSSFGDMVRVLEISAQCKAKISLYYGVNNDSVVLT